MAWIQRAVGLLWKYLRWRDSKRYMSVCCIRSTVDNNMFLLRLWAWLQNSVQVASYRETTKGVEHPQP